MPYFPKSQVLKKSTEGGPKFEYLVTGDLYEGNYLEHSSGRYFIGHNNFNTGLEIIPIIEKSKNIQQNTEDVRKYNILKTDIKKFLTNTLTIPSMKKYPSENDYTKGFFTRYFSRRINGTGYQEIDEDVYKSISKKEKKYDHNLYEIGKIKWSLKGNVFKNNALALKEEENFKWKNLSYLFPIFDEFAREPFQNQENLYTEGGELYYSDSTEYIGAYHIHNTRGPMRGAYHTEENHPQLYYTDELPTPSNMSYEEFLEGYPPPTLPIPILPIRERDRDTGDTVDPPYTGESYNCVVGWGPTPPGYIGMTNSDGLTPISSTCIDPGDGSGMYNIPNYGSRYHQACKSLCEGAAVPTDTDGGAGCMFSWDHNYCSTCTIHVMAMCVGNYSNTPGGGGGGGGYGAGRGGVDGDCFIGETPIIIEDGTTKRIDEVIIGDIVKSEINTSTVIGIDVHKEKQYTIYSLNNSEYFVTAEHPFKTTTGWKAIDPLETWKTHGIESNTLEIGDILITKGGTEELKSINKSTKTVEIVYNLRLDNEHVYYANGYLVHNNKFGGMDDNLIDFSSLSPVGVSCPCGQYNGVVYYNEACC